jgi:hypothetical protein
MGNTATRHGCLLVASIAILLAGTDAYAGDDVYCRHRCGYPTNPYWESCFQKCMGPPKHKTETMKSKKGGSGINKNVWQKPCGPGYMWSASEGRCVSAKATR